MLAVSRKTCVPSGLHSLGAGGGGEDGGEAIAAEADDIASERREIAEQGVEAVHRERFAICWVGAFAGGPR